MGNNFKKHNVCLSVGLSPPPPPRDGQPFRLSVSPDDLFDPSGLFFSWYNHIIVNSLSFMFSWKRISNQLNSTLQLLYSKSKHIGLESEYLVSQGAGLIFRFINLYLNIFIHHLWNNFLVIFYRLRTVGHFFFNSLIFL